MSLFRRCIDLNVWIPTVVSEPLDLEDGRVLDVAIAARADALVTCNFRDFTHPSDVVVGSGRIHVRETAVHRLVIAHPPVMARWLRTGEPPPSG